MIKWYRSLSNLKKLAVMAVAILIEVVIIYQAAAALDQRKANKANYLVNHHCLIVNYVGRDVEPVYQCDTGLLIDNMLDSKVNP